MDDIDISNEVRDMFVPGNSIRLLFPNPKNPNNKLMHILAVVDTDWIVYKTWASTKHRWFYWIENIYLFELFYRDKHLYLVRKNKRSY